MIDWNHESVLRLGQAARLVPGSDGRGVSTSTIWRWATRGLSQIKLEVVCCGGAMCTSREALGRFFAAVTEARQRTAMPESGSTKAAQRAEQELYEAGF